MSIFGQEPWALSRDDLDLILEVVSARAEQMRATMEFERRYNHDPSERLTLAAVETWNRLEARVTDARDNISGVKVGRFEPEISWRAADVTIQPEGSVVVYYDAGDRRIAYHLDNATPSSPKRPTPAGYARLAEDLRHHSAVLRQVGTQETQLQSHHLIATAVNLEAAARLEAPAPLRETPAPETAREATAEAPERVAPGPGRILSPEVADELYAALTMNSLPGLPPANDPGLEPDDWSQSPPAVDHEQPGRSIDD